jgi:mRNA interferase RelE/StbE
LNTKATTANSVERCGPRGKKRVPVATLVEKTGTALAETLCISPGGETRSRTGFGYQVDAPGTGASKASTCALCPCLITPPLGRERSSLKSSTGRCCGRCPLPLYPNTRGLRGCRPPRSTRIQGAIALLGRDPRPRLSRPLRGRPSHHTHGGHHRILDTIREMRVTVAVVAIGHRREVYS